MFCLETNHFACNSTGRCQTFFRNKTIFSVSFGPTSQWFDERSFFKCLWSIEFRVFFSFIPFNKLIYFVVGGVVFVWRAYSVRWSSEQCATNACNERGVPTKMKEKNRIPRWTANNRASIGGSVNTLQTTQFDIDNMCNVYACVWRDLK